jgi:hypothetical protein
MAFPNPPLGWWAKKAAGKKVKQTPLQEAKPGTPDRITIAGADLGRESANLAAVREQTRVLASEGDDNEAASPHPIVDRTIAKLRKEKPSGIGLVTVSGAALIKCEVAPQSIERLAVILPRIVRAASLQGFQLVGGEGSAHFKSDIEAIGFSISELVKREKHALTDAERAKEEAWQRKRHLAARRNAWDAVFLDRPRFPEWDYHPTDQLSFEFEQVYVLGGTGPRRSGISLPEMYQFGPPEIRSAQAAKDAARVLESHGWLVYVPGGAEIDGERRRDVWRLRGQS